MAVSTVKTVISDQLIIKACNTQTGSGGVRRWNNRVGFTALRVLGRIAKEGDPMNHAADYLFLTRAGYVPGCYRRGFRFRRGGNQHETWTVLYNTCPHAVYVEKGRGRSVGTTEVFTWSKVNFGGTIIVADNGTGGFKGEHILYPTVAETAQRLGLRGGVRLLSKPLK